MVYKQVHVIKINNNKLEEVWQYSQTYMHTTYI